MVRRHIQRIAIVCLIVAVSAPASAQYFGRNKIRYRAFDFQVLQTEHFDVYFYSSEREGVEIAARLAERWYARLERVFAHKLDGRQALILYASHTDFAQTNVTQEELGEGTGGFTEPLRRRILLSLAGPIADTDHIIGHELVHAFQFDLTKASNRQRSITSLHRLPLWFVEGMAEYLSLGPVNANTAMRLRAAAQANQLPSLLDLSRPKYFPYQWGHAVFAYIAGRYGDLTIRELLLAAASAGSVEVALKNVLGVSVQQISSDWHDAIRLQYATALTPAGRLSHAGRRLIGGDRLGAELNVGPALSPDGRWVAFLSARDFFSADLYIAETTSGRIVRRLTDTATDAHYSSIGFISSAGTWDPSSERIMIATVVGGRASLTIFNIHTGKRVQDITLNDVDEILNPAWSPDGRLIALTGLRGGLTDLFVYDLETATLREITSDAAGDVHPAWSPDSRRIVFASDRVGSDLETLRMSPLQLVIADVATGTLEPVRAGAGKQISPQWSGDGRAIYFIADADGVSNVYRVALADGLIEQITAVATGVSGITPSSPAFSLSGGSGQLAVSIYADDRYEIYLRDVTEPAVASPDRSADGAVLPPANQESGMVASLLQNAEQGLPDRQAYPIKPYKAQLSIAGIGQPTAGAGVSRFGASASGGGAVLFSDMLGDHLVATAVQVDSGAAGDFSLNDIAFETAYINLNRRWNWGFVGSQIPYVTGTFERVFDTASDGDVRATDRQVIYRETHRSGSAILAYPFDRARRVEFQGRAAQTTFERTVDAAVYSPATGAVFARTTETSRFPSTLNLATGVVALVSDSTVFGPTGPLKGQRYRLEVSPTVGSIDFTGVLVDYRRYVMPVSFYTIAARVMHYGRYGGGGDDNRLYAIYINDPGLVRGYDALGYYATDCVTQPGITCRLSDHFVGSRMLVGNLELRFPLLRPLGVSPRMWGMMPIEVALFADSGVAWTGREKPMLFGGSRAGISSSGVALRLALGVAVLEFDFTRPFQRPDERWVFGLNLIPSW